MLNSIPKSGPRDSFQVITKTPDISADNSGSVSFDHLQGLHGPFFAQTTSLLDYRIYSIKLWTSNSTRLCGIQVSYQNVNNWIIFETPLRCGSAPFDLNPEKFVFDSEVIIDVQANTSEWINSLKFFTSKQRIFAHGGDEGRSDPFSIEEGNAIIGIYGSTEPCLQKIGFYIAPLKDVRYWRRRLYILMKAKFERNKELREEMAEFAKKEKFWPGIAFAALVGKGNQIFHQVMIFV